MINNYCTSIKDVVELSMPNQIKLQQFDLDENYMYALTKDNAKKALICINNDLRYQSPYKSYYKNLNKKLKNYNLQELNELIVKIARSNSTRTSNNNVSVLANYIYQNKQEFVDRLENGDTALVENLANCKGLDRKENSLASKLCAYICEMEHNTSKFIINDNVVRKILPYYLKYYQVDEKLWRKGAVLKNLDKCSYKEIYKLIKTLKSKLPQPLEFSEIDNILWYCYKSDPVRLAIAVELAKS